MDIMTSLIRLSKNNSHEGTQTKDQKAVKGFLAEDKHVVLLKCLENCHERSSNEVLQESLLKDEHKAQRKKAPERENTMGIVFFSDERIFDLDGIYNSENEPLIRRK